jgi:hypothetical protein
MIDLSHAEVSIMELLLVAVFGSCHINSKRSPKVDFFKDANAYEINE